MDLDSLKDKAKDLVDGRGGVEGLKEDLRRPRTPSRARAPSRTRPWASSTPSRATPTATASSRRRT